MQRFAERHGLKQVEGGVEYEGKVVLESWLEASYQKKSPSH